MSVADAAKHFGVSRSTIYRRIKRGQLSARKVGHKWIVELDSPRPVDRPTVQGWHPQIHRRTAEKNGRTPADFTWLNYPISDVRLALPPRNVAQMLLYSAKLPVETPQVNQYFKAEAREPGKEYKPVQFGSETWWALQVSGTALSRVKFLLIDAVDGEVLHEASTGHIEGLVEGGMGEGPKAREARLWKYLLPGKTLRVRLEAVPLFFPYVDPETGSGGNEYATVNDGYLGGEVVISPEYELRLTSNDLDAPPHLLLDGQPAPEPEAPQLRGPAEGEAFDEWLRREREAITLKDSWVTIESMAGQLGMPVKRYAGIEAGTVIPEDWERHNIEDVMKGWQEFYS